MRPVRLSTYASGFARKYKTDEAEIRVASGEAARERGSGLTTGDPENAQQVWRPATIDFQTQAQRLPPALGVSSFADLLNSIRERQSLIEVHWFGHGTKSG